MCVCDIDICILTMGVFQKLYLVVVLAQVCKTRACLLACVLSGFFPSFKTFLIYEGQKHAVKF